MFGSEKGCFGKRVVGGIMGCLGVKGVFGGNGPEGLFGGPVARFTNTT